MVTKLSCRNAPRLPAPDSLRGVRWLDAAGAPLLLAAVVAVVTLAAAELAPARAPVGLPDRPLTAE
jgi:hypothetical protein